MCDLIKGLWCVINGMKYLLWTKSWSQTLSTIVWNRFTFLHVLACWETPTQYDCEPMQYNMISCSEVIWEQFVAMRNVYVIANVSKMAVIHPIIKQKIKKFHFINYNQFWDWNSILFFACDVLIFHCVSSFQPNYILIYMIHFQHK